MATKELNGLATVAFPDLTQLSEVVVTSGMSAVQLKARLEEYADKQNMTYPKMRAWFQLRFMRLHLKRHFTPEQIAQLAPDMRFYLGLKAKS